MHILKPILLWALLPLCAPSYAQTDLMSLDEAIKYALDHVNGLKVAQLNVKDADLAYWEAKAGALPQVTANFSFNYFYQTPTQLIPDFISPAVYGSLHNVKDGSGLALQLPQNQGGSGFFKSSFVQPLTTNVTFAVNQLLFSGSYTVALRAAKANEEYVHSQVESKQLDIRNQVIDAYLPSLLLVESIKTLDKNISNLEKTLSEVKATLKAGFVEQLDVDRLELSLSNLKTERENVDRQRGTLINVLKLAINYPYEKPLAIADDINKLLQASNEADLLSNFDVSNRPEVKVLDNVAKLNQINVDLQKAGYLPTIAAFANYQPGFTGSFSNLTYVPQGLIGLSASINLWDSNERKNKIQRAQLMLDQVKLQKEDLERGLSLQVLNARITYDNAKRRVASQEKNLALAERIYNTTQIKYKNGVGSSLEVTTAEQALYSSQANLRQAQYDLLAAIKSIQKALGK